MFRPFPSLSGPEFLFLFGALIVIACVACSVYFWRLKPRPNRDLDLFEMAYYTGGRYRAVVTSFLLADAPPRAKKQVYDDARESPFHAKIQSLRGEKKPHEVVRMRTMRSEFAAIRKNLKQAGFMRFTRGQARLVCIAFFLPVYILGGARLITAIQLGNPFGVLALLLCMALWLNAIIWEFIDKDRRGREYFGKPGRSMPLAFAIGGGALLWSLKPALAEAYGVPMGGGADGTVTDGSSCSSGNSCASGCGG